MRHLSVLFLSVAVAVSACGGSPSDPVSTPAPAPSLPPALGAGPVLGTDRLVFDSTRHGAAANTNHEIYVMRTDGSGATRMTNDTAYENWWPRVSPDRRKVLFYRSPAGSPENYALASLWAMNTDGSAVTRLRAQGEDGWSAQGHAEWSPDGTKIAMFGSAGAALEIFVTNASGKGPVQYTQRGGINTDVSWSPNGAQLLFNGCANAAVCQPANYEIFLMNAVPFATAVQVTNDTLADYDAYFSPDGSQIAWLVHVDPTANPLPAPLGPLGSWAIRIATIGSPATYLINDGNVNSKPAWSLDGQTIYFHRMVPSEGIRFRVFSIKPSGAPNLTELTTGSVGQSEHPSN